MVSTRQAVVIGLLTRKSVANLQIFFEKPQLFSKNRTNFLEIFSIQMKISVRIWFSRTFCICQFYKNIKRILFHQTMLSHDTWIASDE